MSFIKQAEKLFKSAEKEIGKKFTPNQFAQLATELLSNSDIHKHFNQSSIHECLSYSNYPGHYYNQRQFGDVALTLFKNDQYFLDLYFWKQKDTDIHAHHFTGAFKMLSGHQHQLECSFQLKEKVLPFLHTGNIKLKNFKRIIPGETQSIFLNEDFIHQTHHDKKILTANLCLRTTTFPNEHLWGYYLHGYKVLHLGNPDDRVRKLTLISSLPKKNQFEALSSFLASQDHHTLITLAIGETWTAQLIDKNLRSLIIRYLKEKQPQLWLKTAGLINGIPKQQKKHQKLLVFMYDGV
jgi:hypothetical protein